MVAVTTDLVQRFIDEAIRANNAETLEKFQALETSASSKLGEIDEKMSSVFKDLDAKLVFINGQNEAIIQKIQEQEKTHVAADEKLTRFATLGEALNETNKSLQSQDRVI